MIGYEVCNVNPKGRKTGDCSTRALVGCLGISYEEALDLQCEAAKKTNYGITDKQVMEYILKQFGYTKMKQPRKPDGKKYMVFQMDDLLTDKQMSEGVFITVSGHHTCIVDGKIQDIWYCGNKTVCNYYVKS